MVPDVPDVPGVPALLRLAGVVIPQPVLMFVDTVVGYGADLVPQWGVYKDGVPIIIADTVTALEFKRDWAIADYPIERGGFESYDKVDVPFTPTVQFVAGGSEANRQTLLDSLEAVAGDLNTYDVVTPERIYSSVNVQRYDYRRTAKDGVNLLTINVYLLEVRMTAGSSGGNAQDASGQENQNGGNVQTGPDVPPTEGSVQTTAGQITAQANVAAPLAGVQPGTFTNLAPGGTSGYNVLPVQ